MTTTSAIAALYVHVPFCRTICGYCDFYSLIYDGRRAAPLVDALLAELARIGESHRLLTETIFVGGGTPTVLPPVELARLLAALRSWAADGVELEFTVEANPATVAARTAAVLADHGINRVSIGAQSFDPAELRVLDRTHRPPQVAETIAICRDAGIERINVDLIFAIPGQSLDSWLSNLRAAIDLGPEHISCYCLTYESGTPLHERLESGAVARCEPDLEARMYEQAIDMLAAAGFEQYEISNFAQAGCECRHNLVYWHNEPYVGIGPAAAGYVDGVRYKNAPDLAAYMEAIGRGRAPRAEEESRTPEQSARETMMLGLRLRAGVDRRRYAERFGMDPVEQFAEPIARYRDLGMLEVCDGAVRLTRAGLLVADTVIADFL